VAHDKGGKPRGGSSSKPGGGKGRSGGPRRDAGKPGNKRRSDDPRKRRPADKDGRDNPSQSRSGRPERGAKNQRSSAQGRDGRTRDDGPPGPRREGPKHWGGVARRGAAKVGEEEWRDEVEYSAEETAAYEARVARRDAEAAAHDRLRQEAKTAVQRSGADKPKKKRKTPVRKVHEREPLLPKPARDPESTLKQLLGKDEGQKAWKSLQRAAADFGDERFNPAERRLRGLADIAPGVPEIQELLGLALYRQGKWRAASIRLEEFRLLTGSVEQHPVLADAYRAQSRWADVAYLWDELREVSPSAELMNEGRVVVAGAMADQGDLQGAIRLLEKKWNRPKRAREYHLTRAYALADLYERVGDSPRSAELFAWVATQNPHFSDAKKRAASSKRR